MSYTYRGNQKLDPDPVIPKTGPRGGRQCGTESGASRHYEAGEKPCRPCAEAASHAKAKRNGRPITENTGKTRSAVRCGTYAGAVNHRKKKEQACFACRVAENEYRRAWVARRKAQREEAA